MTVKSLLDLFGYDACAHIVFKYTIDDRAMGRNDQKVALAGEVPYTAIFPGHNRLLKILNFNLSYLMTDFVEPPVLSGVLLK